jgi:predicted Zn finger-like uncharacterized protein
MEKRMMRVQCPGCGAGYRVDSGSVPPEGGTSVCRKCGRRFMIRRPEPETASVTAARPVIQSVSAKPTPAETFACPLCGHRQVQPFTCYACGAVITPREPDSKPDVETKLSATAVDKTPVSASMPLLKMGEVVVRTRFDASSWLLNFARPRVSFDGMDSHPGWGVHAFQIPDGDCDVVIDHAYLTKRRGRRSLPVQVSGAGKVYVDYYVRKASETPPAVIRQASAAEGLLWPITPRSDRPSAKGWYSRNTVIVSLIVAGPLGLFPLWKSDAFTSSTKIIITVAVIFVFYWTMSKLSVSMKSVKVPLGF